MATDWKDVEKAGPVMGRGKLHARREAFWATLDSLLGEYVPAEAGPAQNLVATERDTA